MPIGTYIDFTLSNAIQFYSSAGNPLGRKGLKSSSIVSLKWRTVQLDWENGGNGRFSGDPNPKIGNTKKKNRVNMQICNANLILLSPEDHIPPMVFDCILLTYYIIIISYWYINVNKTLVVQTCQLVNDANIYKQKKWFPSKKTLCFIYFQSKTLHLSKRF